MRFIRWRRAVGICGGVILFTAALLWITAGSRLGLIAMGYALAVESPPSKTAQSGDLVEFNAKISSLCTHDVTIVGATLPCGCLDVSPLPMTISPGKPRELLIRLDTHGRPPGRKVLEITLILDTKSPPVIIQTETRILPSKLSVAAN